MPILTAAQVAKPATQAVTVTVKVSATADQTVAPAAQAATLELEHFPDVVVTANQQLAPGTQTLRLVKAVYHGPATPRPERQPAKPR